AGAPRASLAGVLIGSRGDEERGRTVMAEEESFKITDRRHRDAAADPAPPPPHPAPPEPPSAPRRAHPPPPPPAPGPRRAASRPEPCEQAPARRGPGIPGTRPLELIRHVRELGVDRPGGGPGSNERRARRRVRAGAGGRVYLAPAPREDRGEPLGAGKTVARGDALRPTDAGRPRRA